MIPDLASDLDARMIELDEETDLQKAVQDAAKIVNAFLAEHFTREKFEELSRQYFVEKSGFVPLNEVLSYGADRQLVHIHLAPSETLGPKALVKKVQEGLSELAQRLEIEEDLGEI